MSKCVSTIKEDENKKIYERNIPSSPLQPYLEVRPVMTKYSYFPIVDPRKETNTLLADRPTYNIQSTFNPGNRTAPWSGFASNINTESILRNQIYALQKCSQSIYVPSSQSDLYSEHFQPQHKGRISEHNLLFKEQRFDEFDPNPDNKNVGTGLFMNATRNQVKDLTPQDC